MAKDQGIDGLGKVQLIEHGRRQAGCRDVIVARSVDVGLPNAALIDVDPTIDEHQEIAVRCRELERDQLEGSEAGEVCNKPQAITPTQPALGLHHDVLGALQAVLVLLQIRSPAQKRIELTACKVGRKANDLHQSRT